MGRLFRFSVKDVLWLTLFCAANLGWYVYKVQPVQQLYDQIELLEYEVATIRSSKQEHAIETRRFRDMEAGFMKIFLDLENENVDLGKRLRSYEEGGTGHADYIKTDDKLRKENATLLQGNYNLLKQIELIQQERILAEQKNQ